MALPLSSFRGINLFTLLLFHSDSFARKLYLLSEILCLCEYLNLEIAGPHTENGEKKQNKTPLYRLDLDISGEKKKGQANSKLQGPYMTDGDESVRFVY